MNVKKLKQLTEKNPTAKRILKMVSERRRNTMVTDLAGLRSDLKRRDRKSADRVEFDATFQGLEDAGIGKVKRTDRGTFVAFQWDVPIREVGAALRGEIKPVKTILRPAIPAGVLEAEKEERVQPNVALVSTDLPDRSPATIVVLRKGKGAETFETDDIVAGQIISSLTH